MWPTYVKNPRPPKKFPKAEKNKWLVSTNGTKKMTLLMCQVRHISKKKKKGKNSGFG